MSTKTVPVIIAMCVLFLAIVACGSGSSATRTTAPPTSTDLPPVQKTAVASATFAPPKSQPTEGVSAAESAYLLSMGEISTNLGQALSDISDDSGAVGDNPSLILDDAWKIKAATHLAAIKIACQNIRDLAAPPRYAAVHSEMLTAAGYFENTCDLYAAGVDELSSAKLNQAIEELSKGNAAVQRATTLINQITAGTPAASAPAETSSSPKGATVKTAANLRSGPGTNYPKTGSAAVGQGLDIVGRNQASDWYQLAGGAWIAAFLVSNPPAAVPIVTVSQPTPAAAVPVRGKPAASASTCDCSGNTLNCDDLTDWDAQACYLRCKEITGQDIHGLDRDSDGLACEWRE